MKSTAQPTSIDDYILSFPPHVQELLQQVRAVIKQAAPDAVETISYQMPLFKYHGRLVYFAAHTNHIGLYPMASGIEKFKKELATYEISKGTVRFPLDQPIPSKLIAKIITFRAAENSMKAKLKSAKK